jgi:hypothetical protein
MIICARAYSKSCERSRYYHLTDVLIVASRRTADDAKTVTYTYDNGSGDKVDCSQVKWPTAGQGNG